MDRTLCLMLVFFGGGLGSLSRLLLDFDDHSPFLIANYISCFLIGISYALTRYRVINNEYYTAFVNIGFLGGLSTFTPLATWSLVESKELSVFLSIFYLLGLLGLFFIITLISYTISASILKHVYKRQPLPSMSALLRAYQAQQMMKSKDKSNTNNQVERFKEINRQKQAMLNTANNNQSKKKKKKSQNSNEVAIKANHTSKSDIKDHSSSKLQIDEDTMKSFAILAQIAKEEAQKAVKENSELSYDEAFNKAMQNLMLNAANLNKHKENDNK